MRLAKDHRSLKVNDSLTLGGIPPETFEYRLSTARATRLASILLFLLAAVIIISSAMALWQHVRPHTNCIGIGATIAACGQL
jgi:hypothetical protein